MYAQIGKISIRPHCADLSNLEKDEANTLEGSTLGGTYKYAPLCSSFLSIIIVQANYTAFYTTPSLTLDILYHTPLHSIQCVALLVLAPAVVSPFFSQPLLPLPAPTLSSSITAEKTHKPLFAPTITT